MRVLIDVFNFCVNLMNSKTSKGILVGSQYDWGSHSTNHELASSNILTAGLLRQY